MVKTVKYSCACAKNRCTGGVQKLSGAIFCIFALRSGGANEKSPAFYRQSFLLYGFAGDNENPLFMNLSGFLR